MVDVLVSLCLLLLLLPFFLIIVVWIPIATGEPPFFFQVRPGKNGRLFKLVKFKSMNEKKDAEGKLLPDDQRFTRTGIFLRKTSLDEIPQLLNVLKGDMSLVGPRPLLVEYLPLYNSTQSKRHEVLPGITGWAQVNGRNTIGWEQKFEYDVWYAEHVSFALDVKIIFRTLARVFKREGINASATVTMEKFTGTKKPQ
ncbi:sugar transferase [Sediminibacterium roseum]|nr:sugar transferase [Sediminibacterium roseum]